MVAMRTAAQPRLELATVFPEVVQEPGSPRQLSTTDRLKKFGRAHTGFGQMLAQRMPLRFIPIAAMCVVEQVRLSVALGDRGTLLSSCPRRCRAGRWLAKPGSTKGLLVSLPAQKQPWLSGTPCRRQRRSRTRGICFRRREDELPLHPDAGGGAGKHQEQDGARHDPAQAP